MINKTHIKDFIKIFLLTVFLYPVPVCSWTRRGISCFPLPPPYAALEIVLGFLNLNFSLLTILVAFISITTLAGYNFLKKSFLVYKEPKVRIFSFIVVWIVSMIIFSIPYLMYGINISPTGGIE